MSNSPLCKYHVITDFPHALYELYTWPSVVRKSLHTRMDGYNTHYSVNDADEYNKLTCRDPWWKYCDQYTARKLLGDISGMRVLELGCGAGRMCRNLVSWGAAKVVGLDISEPMIAQAKKNSDPDREEYHVKDCFNLEHIDHFDLVVSYYTMHYASSHDELNGYIRAGYDNLKPGGLMVGAALCILDDFPLVGRIETANLTFRREKYGLFEPVYIQMGSNTENSGISVVTYSLYPDTVEKAFQETGFEDFTRNPLEMSKEGEKHMKIEDLKRDCGNALIFKARKPIS